MAAQPAETGRQRRQFVVMGGEQGPAAVGYMQMFDNRPGDGQSSAMTALANDLPLFQALEGEAAVSGLPGPSRLEETLRDTDTDALTPREALDLIYRLKDIMEEPDN